MDPWKSSGPDSQSEKCFVIRLYCSGPCLCNIKLSYHFTLFSHQAEGTCRSSLWKFWGGVVVSMFGMILHMLEHMKVLQFSLPLTVWSTAFRYLLVIMREESGYRYGTKGISLQIVILLSSTLLSVLPIFLICHMGSFKWKCSLFKPSFRYIYLEFISSFYGWYFHLSFFTSANFPAKVICVYINYLHSRLARIRFTAFLWFKSTVFCLYLSVMLESVGIHGVCTLWQTS